MKVFDANLPFFKGNMHMHTTISDGAWTPEQAKAAYAAAGYDFIAITDHRVVGATGKYENMLVMSGAEYDYLFADQALHIVAVLPDDRMREAKIPYDDHEALLRMIGQYGGAAILAHPAWSLNTTALMRSLPGICGAEVYNTFSGIPWNTPRADSGHVLDLLATSGRLTPFVAGDDSHHYQGEQCQSWTMVQARECTPQAILEALRAGRFYASQGPKFEDVEVLEDRMIVKTSPVDTAVFVSNMPWVEGRCRTGKDMTVQEYRFQRDSGETFVRCEIMDAQGRRAWLSPLAL